MRGEYTPADTQSAWEDTCAHQWFQEARWQIWKQTATREILSLDSLNKLCCPSVSRDLWVRSGKMPRPKPPNPPSDYVTRAQLVRTLKPPAHSFSLPWVRICPSGLLVFAAACIDLGKPRTADSPTKKTCEQRFLRIFSFPSDSSCSLSGQAFAKAQFDYSEDSTFYTEHSVNYRSSFVQRNLKSCSN